MSRKHTASSVAAGPPPSRAPPRGPPKRIKKPKVKSDKKKPPPKPESSRPVPVGKPDDATNRSAASDDSEFQEKLAELMADSTPDDESDESTDADDDVEEGGKDAPPPPPKRAPPFSVDLAEDSAPLEPVAGRVQFSVIELSGLQRQGIAPAKDVATLAVRLKLQVGGGHGAKSVAQASPVIPGIRREKATLDKPVAMFVDILEPNDLQKSGLPLQLSWELHEASGKTDKALLGQGSLDFTKVYKCYGGKKRQLRLDLSLPGKDGQDDVPVGEVLVDMQFFIAWPGLFVVTCLEARGLPNMELMGKQDPFVEIKFAKQKQRSSTVKDGGENPIFPEEELCMWVESSNWMESMTLTLWDEDVGKNDFIGKTLINLLEFSTTFEPQIRFLELSDKKGGEKRGELKVGLQFFPAGRLRIKCFEGKGLGIAGAGNPDLYVQFSLDGKIQSYKAKTKVDKNASDSPIWNEVFEFWVVDHMSLKLEVFDHDVLTSDDLIGTNTLPLGTIYKEGLRDGWIPVRARTTWGALEDRGEVKVHVDFSAPEGVCFPQMRPETESYSHQDRVYRDDVKLFRFQRTSALQVAYDQQEQKSDTTQVDKRFTDEDIEAAFKFIDLDKNLVVGAAEIRHILTCMGEMITGAEVEMMIGLCDKSGNGNISFDEFYAMCKHPDPASDDFLRDDRAAFKAFKSKAPPPPGTAGSQRGLAAIRAQENQKREEKRVYCLEFIRNNALRLPDLKRAFLRFRSIGTSKAYMVTFEELIATFDITFENDPSERDRISRYRQMYNVFVDTQTARLDLRQFLLALNNFTNSDRNQRVNFCFYLYDVDNTGSLDHGEIASILKGNHMTDGLQSVEGKAKTIMKQADKDGNGTVDLEEFVIVAEKFPSLLFPNFTSAVGRAAAPTGRLSARSTARPSPHLMAGASYQRTGLSARQGGPKRAVVGQDTMFAGMPSARRLSTAGGNMSIAQQRQAQAMQHNMASLTARGLQSARGGQYSARQSARPSARQARLEALR